ncbi:MAG: hypothetical protein EZS26_002081 [Candidatus Ordinivivax streblomastigis]|uniref:Uncharacterized protein n=1 Tax=Candidatus Ordinivivax streblomastigis TaxID=2540710 RepID=A0A5M8P061_9BACT|nr:MAG: hypothetical protein EZS26_002081 [Candidatus Ordinivivax streblomastigis]
MMKHLELKKWEKQTVMFLLCFFFSSCEKDFGYRFAGIEEEEDVVVTPPSDGGETVVGDLLVFHDNFQLWKREGYDNSPTGDCEADQMTTATVMYVPSKPRMAEYNGLSVAYMLKDFAVNPVCGTPTGSADSEVSTGFIALQQTIFYECGQHDSDAQMVISELPSVSQIKFSVSLGGKMEDMAGLTLWKKAAGASAFTKVGDYLPSDPQAGEVFTVDINEKNVQLKFTTALTGKETPVNDGIIRAVRIHDLWVYSMNNE